MSLIAKAQAAAAESAEDQAATATTTEASTAKAAEASASPAAVAERALANHKAAQGAVATSATKANVRVIDDLKNNMVVDFDTLAGVAVNQGKFKSRETEKSLGATITLQLMSYQDGWVVSPGDMKAPKDLIRYSRDGKVADSDGVELDNHLAVLLADWPKAKKQHRCTIVGALVGVEAGKDDTLVGQLIQIDMSPASKKQFDRYRLNSAWKLSVGQLSEADVLTMELTATDAKGPDNTDYTLITFQTAPKA